MKPKCPISWLPRVKLTSLCFTGTTLLGQLAEIALDCGFADQSHFTRVFTREEGTSPGSWRRCLNPATGRIAA